MGGYSKRNLKRGETKKIWDKGQEDQNVEDENHVEYSQRTQQKGMGQRNNPNPSDSPIF